MTQIAGIIEPGHPQAFGQSALSMLTLVGISTADEHSGFAAVYPSQFASLGPYDLVLDGTVYNVEDLPPAQGPEGDAARILAAIEREGPDTALARLNADFALALRDNRSNMVMLARDRFGVRPLYHTVPAAPLAFASRPRALLALHGVSSNPDPGFLMAAAATSYRMPDTDPIRAPFSSMAQVPAGHIVTLQDGQISRRRFADIEAGILPTNDPAEQHEAYLALLRDSVARRLKRAAKPAFTLSGGLDSSTITALAKKIRGAPQTAISSVHRDKTYDEREDIAELVDAGLVDWHPVEIDDPDMFDVIARMSAFHDSPIPTVTWMSHYLLAEKIRELGYESVLGGLGGDEQHAGEYDYFFYHFADLKREGRHEDLAHEISCWQHHHNHPIFQKSKEVAARVMSLLTNPDKPGVCRMNTDLLYRYRDVLNPGLVDLETLSREFEATSQSYLASHMRNELLYNTMPCCLRAGNHNAGALGLREYHPFLDWRLFNFMLALPGDRKIRHGVTKVFAREAYEGLLPNTTLERIKKTGWNAPAHRWFAGEGRAMLHDLVTSRPFRERGIYNIRRLRELIDEHAEIVAEPRGREDHMMVLWQVVTLEFWLRSVKDLEEGSVA